MSIEEFHGLLGTLRSVDNTARAAAEATYNSTKETQPVTVLTFLAQTIQCPDEGLRAFAAVLFRRSCPELWRNPAVDAGTKTVIKGLLIETIRQVGAARSTDEPRRCACLHRRVPSSPAAAFRLFGLRASCACASLALRVSAPAACTHTLNRLCNSTSPRCRSK